jgi:hypothetical protein
MQSMGFKRKFKKGMIVRVIFHNPNSFERKVSRYQRIIRKRNRRTDNTMANIKRTDNTMANIKRTDNTMANIKRTKRKRIIK